MVESLSSISGSCSCCSEIAYLHACAACSRLQVEGGHLQVQTSLLAVSKAGLLLLLIFQPSDRAPNLIQKRPGCGQTELSNWHKT